MTKKILTGMKLIYMKKIHKELEWTVRILSKKNVRLTLIKITIVSKVKISIVCQPK